MLMVMGLADIQALVCQRTCDNTQSFVWEAIFFGNHGGRDARSAACMEPGEGLGFVLSFVTGDEVAGDRYSENTNHYGVLRQARYRVSSSL